MFRSVSPKLFFISLMVLFTISANAQKDYFIYLQTEGGQPFYAKFNNKLISSSSEGYIILSGVNEGVYNLVVGFPRNEFPEENFTISVDNRNEGFVLKNFDEKGWKLFNLQTLDMIAGVTDKVSTVPVKKNEDAFSKMLAGVVKDSSILQNHEVATVAPVKSVDTSKELKIVDSSLALEKADSSSFVSNNPKTSISNSDSSSENKTQPDMVTKAKPGVSKILSVQDKKGLQMIYQVTSDSSKTDTVRIFMPNEKNQPDSGYEEGASVENTNILSPVDSPQPGSAPTVIKSQNDTSVVATPAVRLIDTSLKNNPLSNNNSEALQSLAVSNTDSVGKVKDPAIANINPGENNAIKESPTLQNEITNNDKDSSLQNQKATATQVKISDVTPEKSVSKSKETPPESQLIVLPKEVTSSQINSDCKEFATTEDFFKLRKKMAAVMDRDDMLKVAKKFFKSKCYSTAQIKDLSFLFLTDEGKYKFFDEAYPFTSDSDQYPTLQSQFTDPYYLNRFKAMIRK